jgi:hypothetical protein
MIPLTELFNQDKQAKIKGKALLYVMKEGYTGLVIQVPKEYSFCQKDYIEMFTEDSRKQRTDITKMKVGDQFSVMFEAERDFPASFTAIEKDLKSDKSVKTGTFQGEGLFSYYNRNIDFTFSLSITKATYQLITKKGFFADRFYNMILKRIK